MSDKVHSVLFDSSQDNSNLQFFSGQGYDQNQYPSQHSTYGVYNEQPTYNAAPAAEGVHHPVGGKLFAMASAFGTGGFADEAPLLEELGINFSHMKSKSLTVLNPFTVIDKQVVEDPDLTGPLVFLLLYGGFLLLSGKMHFGYVYGLALLGCTSIYIILNLMSAQGINGSLTASVLGYCLMPLVLLAGISMLFELNDSIGYILTALSVVWCTYSASTIFVTVLSMKEQKMLVAYPIGLLYAAFALMTVFNETKK